MARLDRYRIGIPRELSEIRTQPWLREGSLTCSAKYAMIDREIDRLDVSRHTNAEFSG